MRQVAQQAQGLGPVVQIAAGKFADHEWMNNYLTSLQQLDQSRITDAQVVDPDRGIDKNHAFSVWRRRTGSN